MALSVPARVYDVSSSACDGRQHLLHIVQCRDALFGMFRGCGPCVPGARCLHEWQSLGVLQWFVLGLGLYSVISFCFRVFVCVGVVVLCHSEAAPTNDSLGRWLDDTNTWACSVTIPNSITPVYYDEMSHDGWVELNMTAYNDLPPCRE